MATIKRNTPLKPLFLILISLVILSSCKVQPGSDCLADVEIAAFERETIQCEIHSFTLSIPKTCEQGGCGLIMDVHGWTMDADYQEQGTGLAALGRNAMGRGAATPYIVVQPSSANASWDGGISNEGEAGDDVIIYNFMQEVIASYNVDIKRIHFGGFSQGAAMTYRFLCNFNEDIASFAPIAGSGIGCAPPLIPVLNIHGIEDTLVSFAGSTSTRDIYIDTIGENNLDHTIIDDGDTYTHHRYSGSEYLWEFIEHTSTGGIVAGHCMPGGSGIFGCDAGFTTGEKIIDFYIAHPKE